MDTAHDHHDDHHHDDPTGPGHDAATCHDQHDDHRTIDDVDNIDDDSQGVQRVHERFRRLAAAR